MKSMRILVIDDNWNSTADIEEVRDIAVAQVLGKNDAFDASKIEKIKFDAILIDSTIFFNNTELFANSHFRAKPQFLMSDCSNTPDTQILLRSGIAGVFSKPLAKSDLLNMLIFSSHNKTMPEDWQKTDKLFYQSNSKIPPEYTAGSFLKAIIENSSVWISIRDGNGDYIFWNKAAEKITGFASEEVVGNQKVLDFIHKDKAYAKEVESKIADGIQKKNENGFEISIFDKQGMKKNLYLYTKGIYDENDAYLGNISIAYDVSSNKLAEAKRLLEKERETMMKIIDYNPYPILMLDAEGRYLATNRSFAAIIKDALPPPNHSFFNDPALEHAGVASKMKEVLKGKPVIVDNYWYDYSILRKAGFDVSKIVENIGREKICLKTIIFPILNDNDGIDRILVMHQEVTQQKIAEEEIKKSLEKKELLLKEINHRVKNNLQIISSLLSLQSSSMRNESVAKLFDEAQNRIKSMALIHENLYETGNFEFIYLDVYLKALAQNLVNTYQTQNHNIQLKISLDQVRVNVKRAVSIGLIINELLSNALKYAFNDNEKGTIILNLKRISENSINLTLEDNGKGIPEDISPLQSETLGLQLVKSLAEQINGKLEYRNCKGAKFSIDFPEK